MYICLWLLVKNFVVQGGEIGSTNTCLDKSECAYSHVTAYSTKLSIKLTPSSQNPIYLYSSFRLRIYYYCVMWRMQRTKFKKLHSHQGLKDYYRAMSTLYMFLETISMYISLYKQSVALKRSTYQNTYSHLHREVSSTYKLRYSLQSVCKCFRNCSVPVTVGTLHFDLVNYAQNCVSHLKYSWMFRATWLFSTARQNRCNKSPGRFGVAHILYATQL